MLATGRRLAASVGGPAASAAASTSSASSSSAALTSKLLLAALPHVPQHGFTPAAVLAGVAQSWPHPPTKAPVDDAALRNLFPGPPSAETSLPIRLFRRWDAHQLLQVKSAGVAYPSAAPLSPAPAQGQQQQPPQQSQQTYHMAIRVLQRRLEYSQPVRQHLTEVRAPRGAQSKPIHPNNY